MNSFISVGETPGQKEQTNETLWQTFGRRRCGSEWIYEPSPFSIERQIISHGSKVQA